jgi:exonuclease VII small subunit
MEALKSLKERLLTRAEIIQRRLETEQKNLDEAYQKLKRRGEQYVQSDKT